MFIKKLKRAIEENKPLGIFLFAFLMTLFVFFRFSGLINGLGSQKVLEAWGDGLKTPTNMMYHIDYDTSTNWFGGMNYPYGEQIVAATELPGMAMLLRAFKPIFPNISEWAPTIIHGEMLVAFFLCAFFLFLLFRQLKLPFWYSAAVAIGLSFLNPLFPRMACHFGLAQPFLIPAVLYGLLLFERKPSYWISGFVGMVVFVGSMLHFYFFGILVLMISLYFLFRLMMEYLKKGLKAWDFRTGQKYAALVFPHYFLMVGISFLFFYFWMLSNDPVLDRSNSPWGFLVYRSRWEGVFLWKNNPYLVPWTGFIRNTDMEGQSYVGLIASIFTAGAVFRVLFLLFRKKTNPLRRFLSGTDKGEEDSNPDLKSNNRFIFSGLLMSISLLVFSLGIPFVFWGCAWLMDYIGPLRQFRSIGRFAWVFYFMINICAFPWIYYYAKKHKPAIQIAIFGLVFIVFFAEALTFSAQTKLNYKTVPYWTESPSLDDMGIDFSEYQATVPLPYFSVGTNDFNGITEGILLQRTSVLNIKKGLPTTGAMLTRSSFSQTYKQWQLVLQPYRAPSVFKDFKDDKPLLLVAYPKSKRARFMRFRHLLEGAELVHSEGDVQYYKSELSDFADRIAKKREKIRSQLQSDTLFKVGQFESTDSLLSYVYEDYENIKSERAYFSEGALTVNLNKKTELFSGTIPMQDTGCWFHLLTWVHVEENNLADTPLHFEEMDKSNKVAQECDFYLWPCVKTLDTNGWGLIEFAFRLQHPDNQIRFSVGGTTREKRKLTFDSFLLKSTKTHLYKNGDGYIWGNNLYFP